MRKEDKEKKKDSIPEHFSSIEEASAFWDTHDLGDYWDQTTEARFEVDIQTERNYYSLEKDLSKEIEGIARNKGVSSETLVNLWLKEKILTEESHLVSR
ncbi:MAG: CopG family antitoxin [bacterium]|nr:CopG family antitoxin [bacterium]